MKWSTHISEFENLLPNTSLQVDKALQLYKESIPMRHGKIIFLAGERGSGRSEALQSLAETFSQEYKNTQIISGKFTDGKYFALSAIRGDFKGKVDAVGNILAMLAKIIALKTGLPIDLILESSSFLFDFIGQLLQTSVSVKNALDELYENPPNIAELPNAVKKLLRVAAQDSPVICLFDDFDEARREWYEFIESLSEEIGTNLPILFFVSLRGISQVGEHQNGESNLEYATRRIVKRGLGEWWYLEPMTREEIAQWIDAETEIGMVSQLHGVSGGIPRWVKELWRDWKTYGFTEFNETRRRWEWTKDKHPTLNPFNDVLTDLIALLLRNDDLAQINNARELLSTAALEGLTFTAEVLGLVTDQTTDDVIDFLDDYFVQSEENPSGILREEGFLTFEGQHGITRNVFRYSFVSDWHWQVLNRFAQTETEKLRKSAGMITALQIAYEGSENLAAKSLAQLYENLGNKEEARHFRVMASYFHNADIMYQQAQYLMTLKTDDWDKYRCQQLAEFLYKAGKAISNSYPFVETIKVFESAEKFAHQAQAAKIEADSIYFSGFYYHLEGENKIAKQKALISQDLHEKIKNKHGKSLSLHLLANIAYAEGDYKEAKSKISEALLIQEEIGDKHGKSTSLNLLAKIAYAENKVEIAIALSSLSVLIYSLIGSGYLKISQSNLDKQFAKANYSEKQAQEIMEKAKAEYAKDEGKFRIKELLKDW